MNNHERDNEAQRMTPVAGIDVCEAELDSAAAGALPAEEHLASCPVHRRRWHLLQAELGNWQPLSEDDAWAVFDAMVKAFAAGEEDLTDRTTRGFYAYLARDGEAEMTFAGAVAATAATEIAEPAWPAVARWQTIGRPVVLDFDTGFRVVRNLAGSILQRVRSFVPEPGVAPPSMGALVPVAVRAERGRTPQQEATDSGEPVLINDLGPAQVWLEELGAPPVIRIGPVDLWVDGEPADSPTELVVRIRRHDPEDREPVKVRLLPSGVATAAQAEAMATLELGAEEDEVEGRLPLEAMRAGRIEVQTEL